MWGQNEERKMSEALDDIKDYRKTVLTELLGQCTPKQQDLFNRMYGSLEAIPEEKIDWAIQQCERTVEKNNTK